MKKLAVFVISLFSISGAYAGDVIKIDGINCQGAANTTAVTGNIGPVTLDGCIGLCYARGIDCEGGTHRLTAGSTHECYLQEFNVAGGALGVTFRFSDCVAELGSTVFFVNQ